MSDKTAIIGSGESVLAFKAAGVDAFPAGDAVKAREILRRLATEYSVILITEDLARELDDLIKRTVESPYPIIVPVPSGTGESGYAEEKIRERMERALGVDVLTRS